MDMPRIVSTSRFVMAVAGLTAAEFEGLAKGSGAFLEKPLRQRAAGEASRQPQTGDGRKGQLTHSRVPPAFFLDGTKRPVCRPVKRRRDLNLTVLHHPTVKNLCKKG